MSNSELLSILIFVLELLTLMATVIFGVINITKKK